MRSINCAYSYRGKKQNVARCLKQRQEDVGRNPKILSRLLDGCTWDERAFQEKILLQVGIQDFKTFLSPAMCCGTSAVRCVALPPPVVCFGNRRTRRVPALPHLACHSLLSLPSFLPQHVTPLVFSLSLSPSLPPSLTPSRGGSGGRSDPPPVRNARHRQFKRTVLTYATGQSNQNLATTPNAASTSRRS